MLGYERRSLILQQLQQKGSLTLRDMVAALQTSESTVRRDFNDLVHSGMANRTYGGITAAFSRQNAMLSCPTNVTSISEKNALCQKAAQLVENGNCIFVDGGTTFLTLMRYLADKDICIVTNNALLLPGIEESKAETIILGGKYNPRFYIATGQITADEIKRFRFDYAFITCDAIDTVEGAVYAADINIASIKQLAMNRAAQSVLISDATKFTRRGLYSFAQLKDFDLFVTEACEYLRQVPIKLSLI